jgi:hypothetical protein
MGKIQRRWLAWGRRRKQWWRARGGDEEDEDGVERERIRWSG